jgi:O-succinylbenzoate synthase
MTESTITLHSLDLFLLDLPQKQVFQSGIGTRKSKETLIVKWTDRDGRVGYGECSCRPDPYFSAEFLDAAYVLIQKFIAPQLTSSQTYADILRILERIRGWNFTKSAVESAVFQIARQIEGPTLLGRQLPTSPIEKVPVGISLGIYNDRKEFEDTVQAAIDEGYQRLKFKIAPSVDTRSFDHINPLLFDNDVYVSFDANGSFRSDTLDKLAYFVDTYDAAIEQPTPPSRFDILAEAKTKFPNLKVCFDEEIESIGDLVKLHQLNYVDEVNLKVGRVGGLTSSVAIINYCHAHGLPCWVGGMFETGVGRLQNLEVASFLTNAKAHDLSPSSRYFKEDIIAPEITMDNGFIPVAKTLQSVAIDAQIEKFTTAKQKITF